MSRQDLFAVLFLCFIGTGLSWLSWLCLLSLLYNTHNRQTCIPPGGFEPAIPARAVDLAAAGVCVSVIYLIKIQQQYTNKCCCLRQKWYNVLNVTTNKSWWSVQMVSCVYCDCLLWDHCCCVTLCVAVVLGSACLVWAGSWRVWVSRVGYHWMKFASRGLLLIQSTKFDGTRVVVSEMRHASIHVKALFPLCGFHIVQSWHYQPDVKNPLWKGTVKDSESLSELHFDSANAVIVYNHSFLPSCVAQWLEIALQCKASGASDTCPAPFNRLEMWRQLPFSEVLECV